LDRLLWSFGAQTEESWASRPTQGDEKQLSYSNGSPSKRRPSLCHPEERSRGICGSADLPWGCLRHHNVDPRADPRSLGPRVLLRVALLSKKTVARTLTPVEVDGQCRHNGSNFVSFGPAHFNAFSKLHRLVGRQAANGTAVRTTRPLAVRIATIRHSLCWPQWLTRSTKKSGWVSGDVSKSRHSLK
jgi:hypothetical protein